MAFVCLRYLGCLADLMVASVLIHTGQSLVDYALPKLLSVSGCVGSGNVTSDCARPGNTMITLNGLNFGLPPVQVIVGGATCTNPTQVRRLCVAALFLPWTCLVGLTSLSWRCAGCGPAAQAQARHVQAAPWQHWFEMA